MAEEGQSEAGIALMREGLAAFQVTGAELGLTQFLALLAKMHGRVGRKEESLALLSEAFTVGEKNKEGYYTAELYRLKGELVA